MQETESIMVRIETSVSQEVSRLAMPNSYPRDRIFNPHFTAIKYSYNKDTYDMCNVRTFVTQEYEIFLSALMLHTKM